MVKITICTSWALEIFGSYIWYAFDIDGKGGYPKSLLPNPNIEAEVRRFARLVVVPEFTEHYDNLRRVRLKETFRYALNYLEEAKPDDEDPERNRLGSYLGSIVRYKPYPNPEKYHPRWFYWLIWDEMFPGESYEITDPSRYQMAYDRQLDLYEDTLPEDADYRVLTDPPPYKVVPPPDDWEVPPMDEYMVELYSTTPPDLIGLTDLEVARRVKAYAEAEDYQHVLYAANKYLRTNTRGYPLVIEAYRENGNANLRTIELFMAAVTETSDWVTERALDELHYTLAEEQWRGFYGISRYLNFVYGYFTSDYLLSTLNEETLRSLLDLPRYEERRHFPESSA